MYNVNRTNGGQKLDPEKVGTPFGKFEKPCFPRTINSLNKIFSRIEIDNTVLEEIAKKIEGSVPGAKFKKIEERPTTKDGHIWRLALYFQLFLGRNLIGEAVILFPIQSNRSIAIYANYAEKATGTEAWNGLQLAIDKIPEKFQKALLELAREQKIPEETVFIKHA